MDDAEVDRASDLGLTQQLKDIIKTLPLPHFCINFLASGSFWAGLKCCHSFKIHIHKPHHPERQLLQAAASSPRKVRSSLPSGLTSTHVSWARLTRSWTNLIDTGIAWKARLKAELSETISVAGGRRFSWWGQSGHTCRWDGVRVPSTHPPLFAPTQGDDERGIWDNPKIHIPRNY